MNRFIKVLTSGQIITTNLDRTLGEFKPDLRKSEWSEIFYGDRIIDSEQTNKSSD